MAMRLNRLLSQRAPQATRPGPPGRVPTTTPRALGTLDAPPECGRLCPVNPGLDSKLAAKVSTSLADALEELHRLQRSLDRRVRRDQ
jgi:hypothetical protein